MHVTRAALGIVIGLVVIGCGDEPDAPVVSEEVAPAPVVPRPEPRPAPEPIYGADGELLESDEVVAGLRLPRGLRPLSSRERRHVYGSDVPLAKVQRYFGPRLVTGQVDARPSGRATYVDAVPRDVRGGEVRLDVTIEPASGMATRVEIVERAPAPLSAPPEEETLREAREAWRQAD
ncbi:hypothetical protein [Sandaracinus amylolyticus]|uniref:Lipoprotein n=1 Tax=Sandaracinus amylolyticus TaxID=927083 RepID=A0A0F6VZ23_9BACT|nr:hypothetical protein [Sandaracinus amylolyticus]AKF03267.1 hypothetical protein DB32_000416 [Sandaracinus amylolyticus]